MRSKERWKSEHRSRYFRTSEALLSASVHNATSDPCPRQSEVKDPEIAMDMQMQVLHRGQRNCDLENEKMILYIIIKKNRMSYLLQM